MVSFNRIKENKWRVYTLVLLVREESRIYTTFGNNCLEKLTKMMILIKEKGQQRSKMIIVYIGYQTCAAEQLIRA